jgi:hypothetical protein
MGRGQRAGQADHDSYAEHKGHGRAIHLIADGQRTVRKGLARVFVPKSLLPMLLHVAMDIYGHRILEQVIPLLASFDLTLVIGWVVGLSILFRANSK